MLDSMEKLIREHDMLPRGCRVLCAVSGGADSVCLLHRLWSLRERLEIEVMAAHYDHGLRGEESRRDAEFVRKIAKEFGNIHLVVGGGDVAREARLSGRGIEETAREMRYRFLQQAAEEVGAERIATAHNANDNAETLLMHLIRGTGLRGLTGIPPVRGNIIRPLLTTKRYEIEQYLELYRVPYVTDSTNRDDTYTRNRIRHQVMPQLNEICPGIEARLTQTAISLSKDESYLMDQAMKLLQESTGNKEIQRVPASVLAQAPQVLALRAVRVLIARLREGNDNCTAAHLHGVLELCSSTDPSAQVDLPGGLIARREYEMLVLTWQKEKSLVGEIPLQIPGTTLAGKYRLECSRVVYQGQSQQPEQFYLSGEIECPKLRARKTGDRLKRPNRPSKSVKKLLIDEKIPQHLRDGLPVLEVDGQVAAVTGLGPDMAFLPEIGQQAWQIKVTPLY